MFAAGIWLAPLAQDRITVQAQTKAALVSGILYRAHPGFLEVQTAGTKNVLAVKVNAATIYWNGKTDKKGTAKELRQGDELMIETADKDGAPLAQKVRFFHSGTS